MCTSPRPFSASGRPRTWRREWRTKVQPQLPWLPLKNHNKNVWVVMTCVVKYFTQKLDWTWSRLFSLLFTKQPLRHLSKQNLILFLNISESLGLATQISNQSSHKDQHCNQKYFWLQPHSFELNSTFTASLIYRCIPQAICFKIARLLTVLLAVIGAWIVRIWMSVKCSWFQTNQSF